MNAGSLGDEHPYGLIMQGFAEGFKACLPGMAADHPYFPWCAVSVPSTFASALMRRA